MTTYQLRFFSISVLTTIWFGCKDEVAPVSPKGTVVLTSSAKDSQTTTYPTMPEASSTFEGLVNDFENKDRVIWQKPDLVINLLGDLKGKTVADIGAGTGYFAFRLVPKADKVIAIDIDKRLIGFMDSIKVRLSKEAQQRFETRHTSPDNPQLAEKEADVVMLVDTYGYIKHREKYLQHIMKGLTDRGEVLIIDFKKENLPADIAGAFTIKLSTVVKELENAGFVIAKVDNTSLDYQYIIQARKPTND